MLTSKHTLCIRSYQQPHSRAETTIECGQWYTLASKHTRYTVNSIATVWLCGSAGLYRPRQTVKRFIRLKLVKQILIWGRDWELTARDLLDGKLLFLSPDGNVWQTKSNVSLQRPNWQLTSLTPPPHPISYPPQHLHRRSRPHPHPLFPQPRLSDVTMTGCDVNAVSCYFCFHFETSTLLVPLKKWLMFSFSRYTLGAAESCSSSQLQCPWNTTEAKDKASDSLPIPPSPQTTDPHLQIKKPFTLTRRLKKKITPVWPLFLCTCATT